MEINKEKRIWSAAETESFYTELLNRALTVIPEEGAVMVLVPMFIVRAPEDNFALFEKAHAELKKRGMTVFDQLPFVDYILGDAPFNYKVKFEIFYKKLINSGKITACYLLPDWEKSEGTRSEIHYCKDAGVPVNIL